MFRTLLGTAAAVALSAAPAMAAPNPAASLSVSKSVRAGSVSTKKNGLERGGFIIAAVAAVAVVVGIIIVADEDDNDNSDSN